MENTQSKIKAIKTKKKVGTVNCLWYKDYTDNLRPQEITCLEENQIVLFADLVNEDF